MNILVCLLVSCICYWRLRNMYYNNIELQFRYKMYKLRDLLRLMVIEKKIDEDESLFDYLDTSLSIAIEKVTSLHLLVVFFLAKKHYKQPDFISFSTSLQTKLKENKYAKEIYDEYGAIMIWYFLRKHFIIKFCVIGLGVLLMGVNFFKNKKIEIQQSVEDLRIYPETSTVQTYFAGKI